MTNYKIFSARARNIENLSHFYGTRTSILSWMHAKRMPDGGRRKKMSKSTLFLSELSRSVMCKNAESDDLNILSTPDTNPFLMTLMLSQNFPRLHEKFVIVPADEASNNYTFVCKRYYVDILIETIWLHLLPGNPTYNLTDFSASEVLDNHKSVLTTFGIQRADEKLDLPYIYWIPKMQKIPLNTDSLRVPRSVRQCLYQFYSPNCLHILSKILRSTAKQLTQEVGSIRCGSLRIQKNY